MLARAQREGPAELQWETKPSKTCVHVGSALSEVDGRVGTYTVRGFTGADAMVDDGSVLFWGKNDYV